MVDGVGSRREIVAQIVTEIGASCYTRKPYFTTQGATHFLKSMRLFAAQRKGVAPNFVHWLPYASTIYFLVLAPALCKLAAHDSRRPHH